MKFTLSWLRDHLDTAVALEEITETLTRIGLEVESVADQARDLKGYTIASVVSAEPHPNADRLRVCLVETGTGAPVQVVCGAPNARTGMKSVFAPPGTFIPGKNLTLGIGTIRGVESRGMLVSAFELGLSDDHEGIIDLPADAPVGGSYPDYAGLADPVIDINLTPNRPDCASVRGIARDLAAAGLGTLKPDTIAPLAGTGPCPVAVKLDFAAADGRLCPAFALRAVRGVTNGPSPEWLRKRLVAIGLRPINALVDITNFITFDRGRPLHVFDAAKVRGGLVVRRAASGETLKALDGRSYDLDPSMVVIADESGPESLAGIMGGAQSGCDETTTEVLIESALWDPLNIAQTGRKLGIVTDARYRFERGVDPALTQPGLDLATRMVLDLCGGEASQPILAGAIPDTTRQIAFPYAEVRRLSGLDVAAVESRDTLTRLGFAVAEGDALASVTPPSWRPDIEGKADLVEEVVRIAGLDRIVPVPLARIGAGVIKPVLTLIQKRTRLAKRALAARGLVEAVTWSFIARQDAILFGGGADGLALANPIASDLSDMRPSLLPGLLKAAQRNADRGFGDVALFEVGQCFASDEPEGQSIKAAAIRRGTARHEGSGRHWNGRGGPVDAHQAKADALALLAALGVPVGGLQIVPGGAEWLHPGRSAKLQFGPKTVIGIFGELHPRALKALDVKGPIVAMEITLDLLPPPKVKPTKVKPALTLSDYQPVTRDFAFVVARSVAAGDIVKAARSAERALIDDVDVFDVYEGPGIEADRKSVAIAVTLQPADRTLTDAEIDAISTKIVAEVGKKTGAVLRG